MNFPNPENPQTTPGRPPVDGTGAAAPPPPPPGYMPYGYPAPPPKRGGVLTKIITSVVTTVLLFSIVMNIYLAVIITSLTAGPNEQTYIAGDSADRIVILPINGLVDDGMYGFMHDSLEMLRADPPKAIVLRVDSGGGYVGPSDRIWNDIQKFKQETDGKVPIIASFSSMAASGAYYIGVTADQIVIEPTGITGSIGVIAQGFTVNSLMEKIGVTPEVVTSTGSTRKDELNMMQPWSEEDRIVLRGILDSAYEQFVKVVVEGRSEVLTEQEVRALATGEIFTAQQAVDAKLVDSIGYLDDALTAAKSAAGIASNVEPRVTVMTRPERFGIASMFSSKAPDFSMFSAAQLRDSLTELHTPRLVYHWPVP